MKPAAALAALVLALLLAPAAHASDTATWPATATVETDGLVYAAQASADAWWHSHGVNPCPAAVYSFPATVDDAGIGVLRLGACDNTIRYAINAGIVTAARAALAGGHCTTLAGRRRALVSLWMRVAHERGHNAGLLHTPSGVMAEAADDTGAPPAAALAWSVHVLPGHSHVSLKKTRRHGRTVTSGCA